MLALALLLLLLGPAGIAAEEQDIAIIVHRERSADLTLRDVGHIYLRRRRFWDEHTPVVPLTLPSGTPRRARSSRLVLRQNEPRLADYWNRQYFFGTLPPTTLASVEAVRRYVASDRNAIGYVPASAVDDSVRILLHLE